MPGTLLDLPGVQDALRYVMGQLADWQDVPGRVRVAQQALQTVATRARAEQDAGRLARLTAYLQGLRGVQQQYEQGAPLLASTLRAVAAVQAGQNPSTAQIADAGRLAGTMASGLSTLSSLERALVEEGANLSPGPSGGLRVPSWAKWAAVALALGWFYTRRRAA